MKKKTELSGITVVRFFASICVVFYHFYDREAAPTLLANLFSGGFFLFFFILSGFMLTYVARPEETQREFWIKRLARIYPVYVLAWFATGIYLLLRAPDIGAFLRQLGFYGMPTLLMVQSWIPKAATGWNWPAWSIAAEIFFWLLFPLAYRWIGRVRRLHLLIVTLLAINALIYFGRAQLAAVDPEPLMFAGTLIETPWARYIAYLPLTFLVQFVIGIALGRLFVERQPMTAPWRYAAIVATLAILAAPAQILGVPSEAYLAGCYCMLIYAVSSMQVGTGPVSTAFMALGKASYALFILQAPVWNLYWWLRTGEYGDQRSMAELLPYLALLIAIALLVYRYVEVPAAGWIKRRAIAAAPVRGGLPSV